MLTDLVKPLLLGLLVLTGVVLFILIAPLLIVAAWLLFWGFVAFVIIAVIAYGVYELWKER